MPSPQLDLLVRRLVLLSGDVRDLLAQGDWETALPLQDEYDETFASLQALVARGASIPTHLTTDLQRLAAIHAENEHLAEQIQASATGQVRSISSVRKVARAYSPLGNNTHPAARYVDGSA